MAEDDEQGFFLWRWAKVASLGLYRAAYNTGGFFAELFGITTSRYEYVLREYRERERRRAAEEARLAAQLADAPETLVRA